MKKPLLIASELCGITPARLKAMGVSAVLSDLDNTLAGYRDNTPEADVLAWLRSLEEAGLPLLILSNAREERAAAFCNPLGLPYIAKAGKPRPGMLLAALERLGVKPSSAVLLGDQFFTDVLAGRNAGVQVILVPPRTKGLLFTLRRCVETPFIYLTRRVKWAK